MVRAIFAELAITEAELGINLVAAREMTLVNETFLQHTGSTDVITFDHLHSELSKEHSGVQLHGEVFICVDEALAQARQFQTSWQSEVVRYVAHGILHLKGYDDLKPALRRKMKRAENRLMRRLSRRFNLRELKVPAARPARSRSRA
jgi:probable rRNA maturation factor